MQEDSPVIYKTVVVDYAPKAATMAQEIQKTVTAMAREGWELVTFSVTPAAKAIVIFRMPDFHTVLENTTDVPRIGE